MTRVRYFIMVPVDCKIVEKIIHGLQNTPFIQDITVQPPTETCRKKRIGIIFWTGWG